MRIGTDRVRKAKAQQLRRDYELLAYKDVEDFALLRLRGLVGGRGRERRSMRRLLLTSTYGSLAPPRYELQLALALSI